MTRSWRLTFGTALAAASAAVAAWLPAAQAAPAALPFAPVDAGTVGQFRLDAGSTFADYGKALTAVEKNPAVAVRNATEVLTSGGRTGSAGLCHGTGLSGSLSPGGFCWDKADDTSNSYTTAGGWTPQGLSGSYDAKADGLWDGRRTFVASWHFSRGMGTPGAVANEFARVSLVNAEGGGIRYNHLLLVRPTLDAAGNGNFTAAKWTHADGVVWYGTKLFVANGRYLQVYDLAHIWKVNSSTEAVGISGSASSARWSNYALPMIGEYRTTTGTAACAVVSGTTPCLNSLSLDRTGADALVSAEFKAGAAGGRVVRWALDETTGLPKGTATAAYSSPVWAMQGAATDGDRWFMAGDCPSGVGDGSGDALKYSCIHYARPGVEPHVLTTSPVLTQNLGYGPADGRLYGINERINSTNGIRVVFWIKP
ncbi:hypothetical protein [Streptomyces coryli]|uniref:hypothetical protein n=1 Tax=Streptomyces coryli TaxID=1128680 RepID=UPI0030B879E4